MDKKLTNSGPLMESADKHSIYTIKFGVTSCFYRLSPGGATDAASLEKAI